MACHFCTSPNARINGCHWTGAEYIRVDVCDSCYDAGKLVTAPRRPRRPRATTVPATDWDQLVAFTRKGR
jgi:hypothetical protein